MSIESSPFEEMEIFIPRKAHALYKVVETNPKLRAAIDNDEVTVDVLLALMESE